MPTFRHGRSAKVFVGGHDLSGYLREASSQATVDTADTTVFGNTAKTYIPGTTDGRASLSGLWAGDADGVDEELTAIFGAEAGTHLTIAPEGVAVGRRIRAMAAHEASYDISASVSDAVAVSAEFQGTGGLRSGVSLHDLTARTATGNGTSVDNAAASTGGAEAYLHVIAASGTSPTLTVKIQDSADNVTFADVSGFTFTQATAIGSQKITLASGTTLRRYARAVYTIGGTGPSFTFHANLIRL